MYPNQVQYFNSIGIYDLENDLRMVVGAECEEKVRKTLKTMIKKFGRDVIYDDNENVKSDIVKIVYDIIKATEQDIELNIVDDEEHIRNYIDFLIT
jgi:ribosomal protein L30/L7E